MSSPRFAPAPAPRRIPNAAEMVRAYRPAICSVCGRSAVAFVHDAPGLDGGRRVRCAGCLARAGDLRVVIA